MSLPGGGVVRISTYNEAVTGPGLDEGWFWSRISQTVATTTRAVLTFSTQRGSPVSFMVEVVEVVEVVEGCDGVEIFY